MYTSASSLVLTGASAAAGIVLAHEFGRNARTDGFLAAYGVYLVLVLGAQAFRLVIVPDLTRAAAEGRLGGETKAYALAFVALAVPVSVLVGVFAGPIGDGITGHLPHTSAVLAASALRWLVPAAFAQLLAALFASALAAIDSYASAAVGFAVGGVAAVGVFVALRSHGLIALAWGLTLSAGIALAVTLVVLASRGGLRGGEIEPRVGERLWRLAQGAAVPLALQALYPVALRLAAGAGVGQVTSLSYAYLVAGGLVTATATALALISAAPLTRRGLDPDAAALHVVNASWVSLAVVAVAAGVFAVVGGQIVGAVLGNAYGGGVGRELGRLVVALAPWMVAFVAFAATFPLLFVMQSSRLLVPLAIGALVVYAPLGFALREAFGVAGIAVGMGIVVLVVIVVLMASVSRRMLVLAAVGLARLALVVVAIAVAAFALPRLALSPVPAAALGACAYVVLLGAASRFGLRDAWRYVRTLHEPGTLTRP